MEEGAEGTLEIVGDDADQQQQLGGAGSLGATSSDPDKHPEKRMKAAYAKFEEERLPELKIEMPGLKLS